MKPRSSAGSAPHGSAPSGPAMTLTRRSVLALAALAAAPDCDRSRAARCAFCGMRLVAGSHWDAGARTAAGGTLGFDTPACLMRYRLDPARGPLRDAWVTEYYGPHGRRTDARAVRYAIGSDVIGPMGPDVVPIDPAREVVFTADHHPRVVVGFDEIDPALLADLARGR